MAYIANTAFEVKVSNSIYDGVQNVAGKYRVRNGDEETLDICSAGFLVKQSGLIPSEGYEDIPVLNGNTWYFTDAATGAVYGLTGDHTGIFAANTYNVHSVVSANGEMKYNLGANTLGLSIPADEIGDFTELRVGEQYKFGAGNFASTPTVGEFVEIDDGLWTASSSTAPASGGVVYGQVLRSEPFNEGASFWGTGYIVRILRAAQ